MTMSAPRGSGGPAPVDTKGDVVSTRGPQMFPSLSDAHLARVAGVGEERALAAGELLFDEGDRDVPMFVVLEGELEVVHPRGAAEEPVTVHTRGQFTGEVNQLADRPSLVRGRARTAARVLVVPRPAMKAVIQTDPELSEILLRAFILRRMALLSGHTGDAIVLGSRHSAATAARAGVPDAQRASRTGTSTSISTSTSRPSSTTSTSAWPTCRC